MIQLYSREELSFYTLEGKWNDYIAVQKAVIEALRKVKFFEQGNILNHKTKMIIRMTTRGIKETLGNGTRFQYLPKEVKIQKIVTLRYLPMIIQDADLIEDEVENYHGDGNNRFAYFINKVGIDGGVYNVRIVVRKKVESNHFYIHHIDTEKSSELLSPSIETVDYEIQNSNTLISCFIEFVNKNHMDRRKKRILSYISLVGKVK